MNVDTTSKYFQTFAADHCSVREQRDSARMQEKFVSSIGVPTSVLARIESKYSDKICWDFSAQSPELLLLETYNFLADPSRSWMTFSTKWPRGPTSLRNDVKGTLRQLAPEMDEVRQSVASKFSFPFGILYLLLIDFDRQLAKRFYCYRRWFCWPGIFCWLDATAGCSNREFGQNTAIFRRKIRRHCRKSWQYVSDVSGFWTRRFFFKCVWVGVCVHVYMCLCVCMFVYLLDVGLLRRCCFSLLLYQCFGFTKVFFFWIPGIDSVNLI